MARIDPYICLIARGVQLLHNQHSHEGWFEGHALINWLNANHNQELNRLYDLFATAVDPQMTGDQQIGKSLYRLGQEKIDDIESDRQITTPTGNRNGRCIVTRWRISPRTTRALSDWLAKNCP